MTTVDTDLASLPARLGPPPTSPSPLAPPPLPDNPVPILSTRVFTKATVQEDEHQPDNALPPPSSPSASTPVADHPAERGREAAGPANSGRVEASQFELPFKEAEHSHHDDNEVVSETETLAGIDAAGSAEVGHLDAENDLQRCERDIEAHVVAVFFVTGKALREIHDKHFYKQGPYGSFDEYLRRRWYMERTYAHRLMKAAQVFENLLPIGNTADGALPLPTSEAQLRPLMRLDPDAQRKAWRRAVREKGSFGAPTASQVQHAAHIVQPYRRKERTRRLPSGRPFGDPAGSDTVNARGKTTTEEDVVNDSWDSTHAGVSLAAAPLEPAGSHHQNVNTVVNEIVPAACADQPLEVEEPAASERRLDGDAADEVGTGMADRLVDTAARTEEPGLAAITSAGAPAITATVGSIAPIHMPVEQGACASVLGPENTPAADGGDDVVDVEELIPADKVQQAVDAVRAGDLRSASGHDLSREARRMVPKVAEMLERCAPEFPDVEPCDLSRLLSVAHTKLQLVMKWT